MKNSAWFKTYYKILDWGWFQDAKTLQVFIYLIARASIEDTEFMGVPIKRGQTVTSYHSISKATGSSMQSVRTAISHLKSTGEITITSYPKFSVITVQNYDKYQTQQQSKQQASNKQPTSKQQATNTIIRNIEDKKIRNKNIGPSPSAKKELREWEKSIPERFRGRFETERDWKIFTGEEVGDDE